jgi:hypothetical protein
MAKQITTSVPSLVNQYRERMNQRLGRIERRLVTLHAVLSRKSAGDPIQSAREALSVEDDFSHITSEMKNIRHDFGGWCDAAGQPKTANRRMEKWSGGNLSTKEQQTWELIREVRDFDVHKAPVTPAMRKGVLPIRCSNGKVFLLGASYYAVKFLLTDGSSRTVNVRSFCKSAVPILKKFIDEFDKL